MKNFREFMKAKQVVKEYQDKGFKVLFEPSMSEIPKELKSLKFSPDIIAISDSIKLVIEVKTYESIQNEKLIQLANTVNSIKGWEFELVYTNPKKKNEFTDKTKNTNTELLESIKRAERLLNSNLGVDYKDASLLLIWGVFENILREAYLAYKPKEYNYTPRKLVVDSVILGIIDKKDQTFIEEIMKVRNKVAHGLFVENIKVNYLERLISLSKEILQQV